CRARVFSASNPFARDPVCLATLVCSLAGKALIAAASPMTAHSFSLPRSGLRVLCRKPSKLELHLRILTQRIQRIVNPTWPTAPCLPVRTGTLPSPSYILHRLPHLRQVLPLPILKREEICIVQRRIRIQFM